MTQYFLCEYRTPEEENILQRFLSWKKSKGSKKAEESNHDPLYGVTDRKEFADKINFFREKEKGKEQDKVYKVWEIDEGFYNRLKFRDGGLVLIGFHYGSATWGCK